MLYNFNGHIVMYESDPRSLVIPIIQSQYSVFIISAAVDILVAIYSLR